MAGLSRLACLFGVHRMYRERREIAGVSVNHYVCSVCGSAVPVLRRTEDEYREVASKELPAPKAVRDTRHDPPSAAERARTLEALRPKVSA